MGLAPGSATAGSFWTPAKHRRLLAAWGKGHSAAAIGKALGTTRSAVLGRVMRARRAAGKNGIAGWKQVNAQRSAVERKRAQAQRAVIRDMAKGVAAGMPRGKAMARAHRAGATWPQIGKHFGTAGQNAYAAGKAWTQRAARAKATRERARARTERRRKLIKEMARAVARGVPQNQAMARARRAGATWVWIAEHLGITQQTAWYRAKIWTEQARPVRRFTRRG